MGRKVRGLAVLMLAALLMVPAVIYAAIPEAKARSSTGGTDAPVVKVDPDTRDRWEFWAGKNSTENVGRIWTDKTVMPADDGDEADFLTTFSAMSSTSNTSSTATHPLDIVLVLDASGSMDENIGSRAEKKTKIEALQEAANGFIDEVAKQNKNLDPGEQHMVSIVKFAGDKADSIGNSTYEKGGYFYNYSQVMQKLTACTDASKQSLKSTVGSIVPNGCTCADYGLELAANQTSGRSDAEKVVVFFTDGEPNRSAGFSGSVANAAIASAKSMKDAGAKIYTIGIYSGVNTGAPTASSSDVNRYMHAVSSNYPDATSYALGKLGTRAPDSSYFKSATNATELAKVFEDISKDITSSAGYPTEIEDGFAQRSGYITFTDTLGDYVEVTGFRSAVINGTTYDAATKSSKGNIDTYTFSGKAKDLVITVERSGSDNARAGDKVTVKVPASLIPLRNYRVNEKEGTFTVEEATPIRVTFASRVKDAARNGLFTPDAELKSYMDANTRSGRVVFYANKWSGNELGDTVASFEPADSNSYYYFQRNTPIYTDKDCTVRAKSVAAGTTYYYQQTAYTTDKAGKLTTKTTTVTFDGSKAASFDGALGTDDEGAYFAKGTARLAFIDELHTEKTAVGGNVTQTARDVLNPQWNNTDSTVNATHVQSHLGNNGTIAFDATPEPVEVPGRFGIKKIIDGRDWTDDDAFTFELTALDGAPVPSVTTSTVGKADADADGKAEVAFGSIVYTEPGTYNYEVRERAGEAAGMEYSTAKALVTVTVTANSDGTLSAAHTVANGTFTNRYRSSLSYSAAGGLAITKVLTGHDMAAGQFNFTVTPADAASAKALGLSEGANSFAVPAAADGHKVKIDVLGGRDVTFTQADAGKTYRYTVAEKNDGAKGYTYDGTVYTVEISVTDDGAGKLTATTVVSGRGKETVPYEYVTGQTGAHPATVPFENGYSASTDVPGGTKAQVSGTKTMTGRPLSSGEFCFRLAYADGTVVDTARNDGSSVAFAPLSYSTETMAELEQAGRAKRGATTDGKTLWTVAYTVSEDTSQLPAGVSAAVQSFGATVTVVDNGDGTMTATTDYGDTAPELKNEYSTGEPVSAKLAGTKVLSVPKGQLGPVDPSGAFTFTVTGEAGAPLPSKTTATNDRAGNVDFGTITFTLDDLNRALGDTGEKADTQSADKAESAPAEAVSADDAGASAVPDAIENEPAAESQTAGEPAQPEVEATDGAAAEAAPEPAEATIHQSAFEPQASSIVQALSAPLASGVASDEPAIADSSDTGKVRQHTFTYTVRESGSLAGVANDPVAVRTVSFTVTDDGEGNLTVTRDPAEGPAFMFTNSYSVAPRTSSVTDQLSVTKVLDGRALAAGEFSFELIEDGNVVATGTNDASGAVTLGSVTYTEPGTHAYTLREVGGGTHAKGVAYDGATYTVVTTVSDNRDGTLSVVHELQGAETAVFSNTYRALPATVRIGAAKVLEGRDLKEGEFTFRLTGEDGTDLTAENDAKGGVAFDELTFERAGTYAYEIREVAGDDEDITYDDAVHTVTVTVTDDGEGNLKAEVAYRDGESPVFRNTYTEPKVPEDPKEPEPPKTPKSPKAPDTPRVPSVVRTVTSYVSRALPATGDQLGDALAIAAAVAAAGIAILIWGYRKRR